MSKKFIKYKRNLKNLYSRASERCDEGDFVSALSSLLHEAENNTKNAEVCARIADIYTELGLFENAVIFWFKYLIRADYKKRYEAYNGLGANYYFIGDKVMAGHYFNKQLQCDYEGTLVYEEVMEDFLDEMMEKKSSLKLIKEKTQKEIDGERISNAKKFCRESDYESAILELDLIEPTSPLYGEALYEKAYAYLSLDELDLAKKNAEKSIEKGFVTTSSLTFIIHLCLSTANPNADKYLEMLIDLPCEDEENKYKKLNALCEFSLFDEAENLCNELLRLDGYDVNTSFIKAFLLYNKGEYAKALKYFKRAYLLSFSPIALYYVKLTEKANEGVVLRKNLRIVFDLPQDVIEKIAETVSGIFVSPEELANYTREELIEVADWCFTCGPKSIQALMILIFARSNDQVYINYLKEVLVNPSVSDEIKYSLISKLYEYTEVKKLYAVFKNYFKEIKARRVDFKEENKEIFNKAYCYAVGRLAPFVKDGFHSLEIGAKELQSELIAVGKASAVKEIQPLAAAMYFYSGDRDLPSDFIYYLFDAEKEAVVKIIKSTESNDD